MATFLTIFLTAASIFAGIDLNAGLLNEPPKLDLLVNSPTGDLLNDYGSEEERRGDEALIYRRNYFFAGVQTPLAVAGNIGVFSASSFKATLSNISEDDSAQVVADDEVDPEIDTSIPEVTAKTCPEGKFLNPKTNRCKNLQTIEETSTGKTITTYDPATGEATVVKICNEGYHLNLDTNRCNKDKEDSSGKTTSTGVGNEKTCPEGKYLNPETNRCKKIESNDGADYALDVPKLGDTAENSFSALGLAIFIMALGIFILIFQFRKEIVKGVRRLKK